MSGEAFMLALLVATTLGALLTGILRLARRIALGSVSHLRPGRFFRVFPLPLGLARRPAVFLGHLVLTWGLLVVALRLVTLFGRVASPGFAIFAEEDAFRRFFVPLHEWTALLMLAAVGFFLLRRWVLKPRGLVRSLSFEVVLFWLALVLFADLLHESAHRALLAETAGEDFSVVSGAFGLFLLECGLYTSELIALSRGSLWGALTGAAAALALAPFGRNTHWLTGWLGVMKESPAVSSTAAGQLDTVTSKALLDAFNCTECGLCDVACEDRLGLEAMQPSVLPTTLRRLVRAGSGNGLRGRWRTAVGDERLARCIDCGDCDDYCPLGIELTAAIAAIRGPADTPLSPSSSALATGGEGLDVERLEHE